MKDKGKGIISLIIAVVVIAVVALVATVGIGSDKIGSASDVKLGLDLAGGVSITYETVKENPTEEEMEDIKYKMELRAQEESTESVVYKEGDNRVNVDIPDVTDANEVLERLGKAGTIYFIYGEGESGVANVRYNSETNEHELTRPMEEIIAAKDVVIDGTDIQNSEAVYTKDNMGAIDYLVKLTLTESGKTKFAKGSAYATQFYPYISNTDFRGCIAIVYDNEVVSVPGVKTAITDGVATIDGQKDIEEARDLASVIRIGALPLELKQIRSTVVGAKLGIEAINTSLLAGLIGFVIILLFMIVYYRIPGLAASLALALYVGLEVICLNIFDVTLTLPGVAGIILSIGMAVDANVIIFQRIREELATGKTVRSAIKIGFNKALSAIVDGNVTTLIAAAILYFLGSGPIKGFAQTLAIGVILSMFTALFVTKYILTGLYNIGFDTEKFYGVQKEKKKVFDFVGNGRKYIVISGLLILLGFGAMIAYKVGSGNSLAYGLDFKGGTSTQITLPDSVTGNISKDLEALVMDELGIFGEIVNVRDENSYIIKTVELNEEQKAALDKRIITEYNADPELITSESISGTVSNEMKSDAIKAVVIATICMLLYIWIRFKDIAFASSAVLALIHDVLIVLTIYAVARISVGSTFIACMLTIVGYSINATIVIFDRIRENLKTKLKKDSLKELVNVSISQTFSRSINTSLTTFIMVAVLAILGVDSVKEFAVPLMGGIVCGAYSSICITGSLWYFYQKKIKKAE